jgi:DNA-binding response OmpR family regulator
MNERHCILIVDDESAVRLFLAEELAQEGYKVLTASSGEEALARLQEEAIDLVLLDLKMEGMDGLQVMEAIQKQPLPPVIIMLTAYATLDSAIAAMRRGGSDYLLKPCSTEELLASVAKGLSRRREELHRQELVNLIEESARKLRAVPSPATEKRVPSPAPPRFLERRDLLVDRERLMVMRQGSPVKLTPTEFRLLILLMERSGQPVSYQELARGIYGHGGEKWEARQALGTHLWRLRRKLGTDPQGIPYVKNIRGQGYMFVAEERP